MKKTLTAFVTAATVVGTLMASVSVADAQHRHRHRGGNWVGPAIVGGIIGGAIIGGAIASRPGYAYPAYAPVEGYAVYPGYGAAPPVYCPEGYWGRRFLGHDRWGNPIYSRPRWFCPY